ncbi:unnamed protein product [Lactuca virosa]|uniref:Uncharacterized protein n=1 Tax=Lactuca virosa TaxID=75947 RepID=A0AAU9N9Z5_9ASTR|nr:unnamed protein product [Lactuca virosa]
MFFIAWDELAQSKTNSCVPSFRRSVLNPRRPPVMNTFDNTLFVPLSSIPPLRSYFPADPLISRIYYIHQKDINHHLQSISSFNGNPKRTKLVSFIAFLWKIIAESDDDFTTCKMGVVVNGRERLNKVNFEKLSMFYSDTNSFSMKNYFGNVLSIPYSEAKSGELKEMPLSRVADMVHEFMSPAMNEEHFRGLIDMVELHRPEPLVARIYTKMEENDGEGLVVSSGQRFPVENIYFGWGKPNFGSY